MLNFADCVPKHRRNSERLEEQCSQKVQLIIMLTTHITVCLPPVVCVAFLFVVACRSSTTLHRSMMTLAGIQRVAVATTRHSSQCCVVSNMPLRQAVARYTDCVSAVFFVVSSSLTMAIILLVRVPALYHLHEHIVHPIINTPPSQT